MTLILVGGPSGVGKSRLAHQLALMTRSSVAQIDDMQGERLREDCARLDLLCIEARSFDTLMLRACSALEVRINP